jgi:hypothetical protein
LEHRRVKRFYARTNKNKYARQCARIERRQRILRNQWKKAAKGKEKEVNDEGRPSLGFKDAETLPFTSPREHHHISESNRYREVIPRWLGTLTQDPATRV